MITKTVYLVSTPTETHTYTDWNEALSAFVSLMDKGEVVSLDCYDCHEC